MQSKTKILFWNARNIVNKKEEVVKVLENINSFMCVESWLTEKERDFNISGFKSIRKDRQARRGEGIVIWVRNKYDFKNRNDIISPDESAELLGVSITNIKPNIYIIAYYRAPGTSQ